ncbi:DUF3619 family protein [Comamonas aquatica]|uniref:DUF3619 family protein n=1 Tax=Comamonas aquatica TaxID=225991 RepID=UPI0028D5ED53|nr:DUF3619 family protein [Comamonas aquatica]
MTTPSHHDELAADIFARKLAAHLSSADANLPYVVTERLRAARVQAVSLRKRSSAPLRALHTESAPTLLGPQNETAILGTLGGPRDSAPLWLQRLLTALPLVALVAGLAFIGAEQDSRATVDVAEVDAALLTSELPPAAFTDPGFQQYLQTTVSDTP